MFSRWPAGFPGFGFPCFAFSSVAALLATASVIVPAAIGESDHAASVITVRPSSFVHVVGTDMYCTVLPESQGPSVACFHDPGGPTSNVRKGYAIASIDDLVGVEPPKSTKVIKYSREPSFSAVPTIAGGAAKKQIIELKLGDGVLVGGTHMAIAVESAKGGGNAVGVLYVDSKGNPIVGSYSVGISNQYVTIVNVTGPSSSKVIYRHAVY